MSAAARARIAALPRTRIPSVRVPFLRRLILAGIAGLVASSMALASATSLNIGGSAIAPAQGSVSVTGTCTTAVTLSYDYDDTPSSGLATRVTKIYVANDNGSCSGTSAAIRFGVAAGSGGPVLDTPSNPSYGSPNSGKWTFNLDSGSNNNKVDSWNPGTITITIYK